MNVCVSFCFHILVCSFLLYSPSFSLLDTICLQNSTFRAKMPLGAGGG